MDPVVILTAPKVVLHLWENLVSPYDYVNSELFFRKITHFVHHEVFFFIYLFKHSSIHCLFIHLFIHPFIHCWSQELCICNSSIAWPGFDRRICIQVSFSFLSPLNSLYGLALLFIQKRPGQIQKNFQELLDNCVQS